MPVVFFSHDVSCLRFGLLSFMFSVILLFYSVFPLIFSCLPLSIAPLSSLSLHSPSAGVLLDYQVKNKAVSLCCSHSNRWDNDMRHELIVGEGDERKPAGGERETSTCFNTS